MRAAILSIAAAAASLALAVPAHAAPTWLPPVGLGADVADTSSIGSVAVAGDGMTIAAWAQATSDGSNFDLQFSRRPPGGQFEPAITVPGSTGAGSVDVGIDGAGNATVSWLQGGAVRVVAIGREGGPGSPQTLDPSGADSPVIAVNVDGRAVVAWSDSNSAPEPVARSAVRSGASGDFGEIKTISQAVNTTTISGVDAAVGDGGNAAVIWARETGGRRQVEVNDRAPGGSFTADMGLPISDLTPGFNAIEPVIVIDATGRETALWTDSTRGRIAYAERPPGQDWSGFDFASGSLDVAGTPAADVAPNGTVVAAWFVSSSGSAVVEAAIRAPGGGGFSDHRKLSGPSLSGYAPVVAVGRGGDALIAWTPSMGEAIYAVHRSRSGAYGPLTAAVSNQNPPPNHVLNFREPDAGVDDEGNATAVWLRDAYHQSPPLDGKDHYQFQAGSLDAAPPTFAAVSVPPSGQPGAAIGMAAAATDRLSAVSYTWSYGDGSGDAGPAVSHAFGSPGAFDVTVTATDAVGNSTSASRPVLITAPVIPPPPQTITPRIDSTVQSKWGFDRRTGRRFFLFRLKVVAPPAGSVAQLRCAGRRCPFQSRRFTRIRNGAITLYRNLPARKVVKKKNRRFRAGQRVQLRVTAPGYIGKVVKWRLKRRRQPVGRVLCLPIGATKPTAC